MKKRVDVYTCDNCNRVLSDNNTSLSHISLNIGGKSGFVDEIDLSWKFRNFIQQGVYHFCDTNCLKNFFTSLAQGEKGYK